MPFLAGLLRSLINSYSRIFLTGSYFVVELVAGVWLDSLSLQADAFHMASDIMGLLIALFAENAKVAKKTKLATYGFARADAVGSLINTTFLLSTCFTITIDALARFREVEELGKRMEDSGIPLLIVACIGLGINIIGLLCFGDQMHVSSPFYHEVFTHFKSSNFPMIFPHASSQGHSHAGECHGHGAKSLPAADSSGQANLLANDALGCNSSADGDIELGEHHHAHDAHGCGGHDHDHHEHDHHDHDHGDGPCSSESGHGHAAAESSPDVHKHGHGSRVNINENMRAAFLHVLGDALGSIGVIISGLVIKYGSSPNRFIVDPLCSLFIVLIIAYSAIPQLIRVTKVVMQFVPEDIDSDALLEEVKLIEGIQDIHDFHVWQLDSMKVIATCHITCNGISEFNRIIPLVKERLHSYGVHSSSIQPELMQDSPFLNTAFLNFLEFNICLRSSNPNCSDLICNAPNCATVQHPWARYFRVSLHCIFALHVLFICHRIDAALLLSSIHPWERIRRPNLRDPPLPSRSKPNSVCDFDPKHARHASLRAIKQ